MKKGYPLFLNLEGEKCLVFGGGRVAFRKIQALLKRGAKVTCVSREFSAPVKKLKIKRVRGRGIHINGARLVIAATSDRAFNARVVRECRRRRIWVNVVDDPKLCDFTVPAVMERGPLQIAISTSGASPLFAKRLREALEKVIPQSTGKLLQRVGRIREKALRKK